MATQQFHPSTWFSIKESKKRSRFDDVEVIGQFKIRRELHRARGRSSVDQRQYENEETREKGTLGVRRRYREGVKKGAHVAPGNWTNQEHRFQTWHTINPRGFAMGVFAFVIRTRGGVVVAAAVWFILGRFSRNRDNSPALNFYFSPPLTLLIRSVPRRGTRSFAYVNAIRFRFDTIRSDRGGAHGFSMLPHPVRSTG